ncbi:MAG: hypothetical protein K6E85_10855 [Lachnospiraceae bacterium]|nr:hypothetical protein [Lachnospiraceae bacterium]
MAAGSTLPGVFRAVKKDGSTYFRASITFKGKHVSLGSFYDEKKAHLAYVSASELLGRKAIKQDKDKNKNRNKDENKDEDGDISVQDPFATADVLSYETADTPLSFSKWVMLINLRDNGIYCRGPIYLRTRYFDYFIDTKTVLRFGAEELFYYTNHTIQKRGGHLFVSDYGSQINILNRYGIPSYAVKNRDYYFKNGDEYDFRAGNIVIINKYHGVLCETCKGRSVFTARIHVNGDMIIGRYDEETDAAIAYNKAADILRKNGFTINFTDNYIEDISDMEYRIRYEKIKISKKIRSARP